MSACGSRGKRATRRPTVNAVPAETYSDLCIGKKREGVTKEMNSGGDVHCE